MAAADPVDGSGGEMWGEKGEGETDGEWKCERGEVEKGKERERERENGIEVVANVHDRVGRPLSFFEEIIQIPL